MGWFDGITNWFSDAADTVSDWAGYGPTSEPETNFGFGPVASGDDYGTNLNLAYPSATSGIGPVASGDDYGASLRGQYAPTVTPNPLNPNDLNKDKSFWDSLTSPSVLGAMITSGAGLFGGMSQMDMQKQQLKAAEEQRKMNQMLELAKLKYQLLGQGSGGGGARRSSGGGGGGANPNNAINAQASGQLASGYQNLGNSLASIYRS